MCKIKNFTFNDIHIKGQKKASKKNGNVDFHFFSSNNFLIL
jgi:hypothetical protein